MRRRWAADERARAGFTLFEALISVALMGAIVFMLSAVSGQWIPNWHRGFGRVQRAELLDLGLQRVVADLQAAEFVSADAAARGPLFDGRQTSVTLVRDAFGPDAAPHLEIVRLAETVDERGFALVRAHAPFTPLAPGSPIENQLHFDGPVVLIRAPFRVSFSFAGPDRLWRDSWADNAQLPAAVRIQVRDAASDQILSMSTATLLHVNVSPACAQEKPAPDCPNSGAPPAAGKPPSNAPPSPGAAPAAASAPGGQEL
jgi:general secretion pathway protein J